MQMLRLIQKEEGNKRFVIMLQIFEKSFSIAFAHIRFDKLAHTFSDKMRIATKDIFAGIVCFLIIRCFDAVYYEQ